MTASGNEGRIQKLAQTQELPDLTKDEVEEIEQVGRKIYFRAYEYVFFSFSAFDTDLYSPSQ